MCNMYCPSCGSVMLQLHATVASNDYGYLSIVAMSDTVACLSCPLVSQVHRTGRLLDLGALTVADIEAPYVAKLDPMPLLLQQPTLLHGRRDS